MRPESENKGPYEVSTNIGWDAFLGFIANKLMVGFFSLVVASFKWHWLKPASGPWLPLQDGNGLSSMLRKVKSKQEPYIIVHMQAPVQKRATVSSTGNAWEADELGSDLEENPVAMKVHTESFQLVWYSILFLAGKTG